MSTNPGGPQLAEALLKPFIEIKERLTSRCASSSMRGGDDAVPGTQRPADRPVIYLDADPDEEGSMATAEGRAQGGGDRATGQSRAGER